ncbi:MAG: twin-arginine translocase TatA/TatE family subunit [Actinomycetota bacterium]|nr:twin-arginine translocase TatA/TatE family subunit [Actinomycetota bacterium]
MPQLGPLEIMAVAVIALIVFGPQRLPEIARTLGRMISEFKRQANDLTSEFKSGLDLNVEDDDDEEDIPEPTSGGLYANADEAEEDPSEPPLTAGADTDPEEGPESPIEEAGPGTTNGAPVQGAREPSESEAGSEAPAITTGESGDPTVREGGG